MVGTHSVRLFVSKVVVGAAVLCLAGGAAAASSGASPSTATHTTIDNHAALTTNDPLMEDFCRRG